MVAAIPRRKMAKFRWRTFRSFRWRKKTHRRSRSLEAAHGSAASAVASRHVLKARRQRALKRRFGAKRKTSAAANPTAKGAAERTDAGRGRAGRQTCDGTNTPLNFANALQTSSLREAVASSALQIKTPLSTFRLSCAVHARHVVVKSPNKVACRKSRVCRRKPGGTTASKESKSGSFAKALPKSFSTVATSFFIKATLHLDCWSSVFRQAVRALRDVSRNANAFFAAAASPFKADTVALSTHFLAASKSFKVSSIERVGLVAGREAGAAFAAAFRASATISARTCSLRLRLCVVRGASGGVGSHGEEVIGVSRAFKRPAPVLHVSQFHASTSFVDEVGIGAGGAGPREKSFDEPSKTEAGDGWPRDVDVGDVAKVVAKASAGRGASASAATAAAGMAL
mmetsp:Transcript_2692/g.7883  ORF Transcript_2692/g.7883 Transcript_2692/m.7883 type:complete len:399 (-) Transcript_2692:12-1208(-)